MPHDRVDPSPADSERGARRPYTAPFLRRLDVPDTEGKPTRYISELTFPSAAPS